MKVYHIKIYIKREKDLEKPKINIKRYKIIIFRKKK